ncbi:integrator complex subunit 11 [Dendrobium catenatum]|uniref:Integrator complex subunit 11 n=1 Tax=Dendrobium catenatum TaxID=906689 RepID=A0A2I0WJY8_9ASPA|nr:integrator complex subunit 11 [Dendrobium catenatum]
MNLEGDRNTAFFHALINKNRIKNHIHRMVDSHGNIFDTEELITSSVVDFFKDIFNCTKVTSLIVNANVIPKLVGDDDNVMLTQPPSEDEIWNIIKEMNGDSVAGPDGFTTKFFIHAWEVIKNDVVNVIHDFFKGNAYPEFFASTNIVLISKKDNPTYWNDFRPISLCTFFNKLVAKIIAIRLSLILSRIISINQTGFVKGRSIFDNILLAQEVVHDLNVKGNDGNIIFKLDITKAYDNLKWNYLYKILHLFGFNQNFIKLIKNSIETCFFLLSLMVRIMVFFLPSMGWARGSFIAFSIYYCYGISVQRY